MKLQAKLMLVIGGAAVAAALLILILTGFRINSISDGFAESSRKMRSESMRREATSAVFAEGAHLDSLFNGMFLRLYMLCLELHRRGGSAELDANEFRTSLKRTIYVTPENGTGRIFVWFLPRIRAFPRISLCRKSFRTFGRTCVRTSGRSSFPARRTARFGLR